MHKLAAEQSPQLPILLPQPSAACPHWIPCASQLCGTQLRGTHLPAMHSLFAGQAGQVMDVPHWSPAWPHSMPWSVQLLGLQLVEPHLPRLQA